MSYYSGRTDAAAEFIGLSIAIIRWGLRAIISLVLLVVPLVAAIQTHALDATLPRVAALTRCNAIDSAGARLGISVALWMAALPGTYILFASAVLLSQHAVLLFVLAVVGSFIGLAVALATVSGSWGERELSESFWQR